MASIEDQLTQLEQDRQDLIANLETQGITGLTGNETFTELVPMVLDISGGADLDDYFGNSIASGLSSQSGILKTILKVKDNITVTGTSTSYMFCKCSNLNTAPLLDTSAVETMSNTFDGCINLANVPEYDTSSATNMKAMFANCRVLSYDSINNILAMCINSSPDYTETKTLLAVLGNNMDLYYNKTTIQGLSNYQDFIDAGWTIGW